MLTTSKGSGDLVFINWIPQAGIPSTSSTAEIAYGELADYLTSNQLSVLSERIYGLVSVSKEILTIRDQCFQVLGSSVLATPTFVEGKPFYGSELAGIHIIAVRTDVQHVFEHVKADEKVCGCAFRGNDAEYLYLSDIGRWVNQDTRQDPSNHAAETFNLVEQLLNERQWDFHHVKRTWFYLDDILDWYPQFNQVRNNVFKRLGMLNGNPKTIIPASTGIFGSNAFGGWCTLDLLAMKPINNRRFVVSRMENPKQNEAPEYGSAFSRGLSITTDHQQFLFVSGTASIDESGATVHLNDFERQTERTMENVRTLLNECNADFDDIAQATVFVKNETDVPVYERIAERVGLKRFPVVCTVADVCRDDLLFELDATAIKTME